MRLNKINYLMSILLSLTFFSLVMFKNTIYKFVLTLSGVETDYTGFNTPDWMINYQGGFVRRGLLGELFYQLFILHPYPFHTALMFIEIVIFTVFVIWTCHTFIKLKMIPIMPFAVLVGTLQFYRRDFLMILMAYAVFWFLVKYLTSKKVVHITAMIVVIIVAILSYEPSFFFIVPVSMAIFYSHNCTSRDFRIRTFNTLKVFCLPIIIMATVCLAKGTSTIADSIWNSWTPLFDYLNMGIPQAPSSITFLSESESVLRVSMKHLGLNYGIGSANALGSTPNLIVGSLLFFTGMYFLTITTPQREYSKSLSERISSIYLFQFLCLIPMFSVLSCDFGRTILYVIFTSYYLSYITIENGVEIKIPCLTKFSDKITGLLIRIPYSTCFYLHLLTLCFIPFNLWGGIPFNSPLIINEYLMVIQPKMEQILNTFGI